MCSKLLIEKNIEEYDYTESAYGPNKDAQAPLFSDDGEQIGTIKCCVALYEDKEKDEEKVAIVCPYNDRHDVENLIKLGLSQAPDERFILDEYKGKEVFKADSVIMVWTHDTYAVAVGGDERKRIPFSEDIADAYLKKYPNDLGETEISEDEILEVGEVARVRGTIVTPNVRTLAECEELTDINEKEECYLEVAVIGTVDINLCEKITDDNLRESCYEGVGQQTKDISICEKILSNSSKQSCYVNVAREIEDVSVCEEVSEDVYRDACYLGIASETNNGELCERMIDTRRREN